MIREEATRQSVLLAVSFSVSSSGGAQLLAGMSSNGQFLRLNTHTHSQAAASSSNSSGNESNGNGNGGFSCPIPQFLQSLLRKLGKYRGITWAIMSLSVTGCTAARMEWNGTAAAAAANLAR